MATEATTPIPANEEITPQGNKGAITLDKPKGGEVSPEEVTKLQAEVEQLTKQRDQQKILQGQADRKARQEQAEKAKLQRELEKVRQGEDYIPPVEEPSGDKVVLGLKVLSGIQNLILENPDYQELLKRDETLQEVLRNNPFALISEYFDAQDAVEQIKEKLDKRVSSFKAQLIKTEPPKEKGKEFEVGAVQPSPEVPAKPSPPGVTPVEGEIEQKILGKLTFSE